MTIEPARERSAATPQSWTHADPVDCTKAGIIDLELAGKVGSKSAVLARGSRGTATIKTMKTTATMSAAAAQARAASRGSGAYSFSFAKVPAR